MINSGHELMAVIFFVILLAFGSYFMINLILAVIMGSFTKYENKEIETKLKEAEN